MVQSVKSVSEVVAESFIPGVDDFFVGFAIPTHLDTDVRVGVAVVEVATFVRLEQLDEHLFVEPGRSRNIRAFLIALELELGLFWIVILYELDDEIWSFLQPLHIEGNFGSNHVFGVLILLTGIDIGVVFRTAIAGRNHHAFSRLCLNVVQ